MAEQIGVLVEKQPNGMSRVLTRRRKARGGCQPGLNCAQLESRAANAVNASVGDVVKMVLPQKGLLLGASLLYVLPMAALLAGVLVGFGLGAASGWVNLGSVLGALGGLGIGLWAVKRIGSRSRLHRKTTPVITEIVRPSGTPPKPPQGPCCG
jgi:sigma-E factor negative regulatory protein RseC